jgi:chromosome segregation ATPase
MMQPQDLGERPLVPVPDPWSGWAQVYALPASVEYDLDEEEDGAPAPSAGATPSVTPEPAPASTPPDDAGLRGAVAQLTAALADERDRRNHAEDALHRAETARQTAEVEAARLTAELAAERTRITQLERDRDEVIRRAEELLTAVRERADQRLAAELEAARRQWGELLDAERRRVEVLDGERAALLKRLEDAWMAGAALRRARPLRPWWPRSEDAEEDGPSAEELAEAEEAEQVPEGESPELTAEIARLRARLRAQLHKPLGLPDVEEGVDRLRETRLARENEGRRRPRR